MIGEGFFKQTRVRYKGARANEETGERRGSCCCYIGPFAGSTSCTMVDPSKYVAMDCEMVGLGCNGRDSGLARCSIVDYDGKVIYDKFIKPDGTITDYRTPVSGIRPSDMDTAVPYQIAREEILEILKGKIIVGHDPRSDFCVLNTDVSNYAIRDTSSCKLLITKAKLKTDRRASLKALCQKLLGKRIQSLIVEG
ncbi:interferon-stimulated gene 20 kDa protein-like isoform X2 [Hypanus sabinus]|uniref:interferon-stimulated gene 20 kDa protein-like isoform X2 n=1 Tax=Hypanus sabinus TaxID=79690 RepID=UPI0028C3C660|nr:interferon-stimulated gene 20 kDa protein-like isoform X2 [Hypanus sabinus]